MQNKNYRTNHRPTYSSLGVLPQFREPTISSVSTKKDRFHRKLGIGSHRLIFFAVSLLCLVGLVGSFGIGRSSASSDSVIRSGVQGNCLDDYHNSNVVNAPVYNWQCSGSAAQRWTINDGTIRHGNQCLSLINNGVSGGDQIVLNNCTNSPSQSWQAGVFGYENVADGLCLSAPDGQSGVQVMAESCDQLLKPAEIWVVAEWSRDDTSTAPVTSCLIGTRGDKIACQAVEQWNDWQSKPNGHTALLSYYSDGNAYEEWCADFVSYVYKQAGYPFANGERDRWDEYLAGNIVNMGYTAHSANGYTPQAGDVAYFDYPGGHVEIVVIGGSKPLFVYGDSGETDKTTGNGNMAEDHILSNAFGVSGQLVNYLSP